MPTLDEQVTWCSDVATLLKQHKKVQSLDIPVVAAEVRGLLVRVDTGARRDAPGSRVVKEYANYAKRFEELSRQANEIKDKTAAKQLKEKVAATQLVQVGQHLERLADLIKLGLSEFDPTLAKDPQIKELRRAAEEHRPVYEDKRNRISSAIEELKRLGPGAETEIQALEALRDAGRFMEPDYAKAYGCLGGLTGLLKEGKKAIARFDRTIDDPGYRDSMQAAETAISNFESVFGLGHALKVQGWRQRLNEARRMAKSQPLDARKAVESVRDGAKDALRTYATQRDKLGESLESIQVRLDTLGMMAPIEIVAPLLQQLDEARSTLGTQQFEAAELLLERLDSEVDTQREAHLGDQDRWTKLETVDKLAELVGGLRAFTESQIEESAPTAMRQAKLLLNRVDGQARPLAAQRRFGQALACVEPVLPDLKAFALWCKTYIQDAADKKPLKDYDVTSVKDPVARHLLDLLPYLTQRLQWSSKIEKRKAFLRGVGVNPDALSSPVPALLKDFTNHLISWQERLDRDEPRAASRLDKESEQDHALRLKNSLAAIDQQFKGEFVASADALLKELELEKYQPAKDVLERRELDKALEQDQRKLVQARDRLINRLKAIDESVATTSSLLAQTADLRDRVGKLLEQVLGSSAQDYQKKTKDERDALVLKITQEIDDSLTKEIDTLRQMADEELKDKRRVKPALVKEAEQLLKQLEGELEPGSANNGQTKASWQAYGETLRIELDAAIIMVDTDKMEVLETGLKALQELIQKVTDLLKLTAGKSAVKTGFEEVQALKDTLEKDLTTGLPPTAEQYRADAVARLLGEFRTSLAESLKGQGPDEAKQALGAFRKRLDEVLQEAAAAKLEHDNLWSTLGTQLERQLDELAKKPGVESLVKKLRGRLDGAMAGKCTVNAATLTLHELQLTLKLALDDSKPEVREQFNMQAAQETLRNESDIEFAPQRYAAAREVFEKSVRRRAKLLRDELPADQRNVSLYQRIDQLAKTADQTAKQASKATTPTEKGKLYDSARSSLDLATEAAEAFLENPLSATAASRKALTECQSRWKIAVGGFVSAVLQLGADMEKAIQADSSTKKISWQQTALPSVRKLVGLVDPNAFDAAVGVLGEAPPTAPKDLAVRRKQKEQAMLRLAQFERELQSHPLLPVLAGNPFVPVKSQPLLTALAGVRAAVLTS
ncbi:hypothetical protein JI742_06630 [Piscinibacter sp. Jin2]|uniref:Uncharacterized protein n=1 Tax=Aquariibacter lacus TaxID=2801332 RepID=A0A9X0XC68_9BURK|nr:hypothetical protein [Piscinibacter lacus]MBL0719562.1 hypothetical protein [Piscinibacter lacus]